MSSESVQPSRVKNIHHLFYGYNILEFDPLDPGGGESKSDVPIFNISNITYNTTPDGRVEYPDGMSYSSNPHTEWSVNGETFETAHNLTESFKASYEIGGGGTFKGFTGSFSQSASYERVKEYTRDTKQFIEHTRCEISLCSLNWNSPKLSEDFKSAISNLPTDMSQPESELAYRDFVQKFGTHYADHMNFGGRGYKEFRSDTSRIASMLAENASISVAAEAAFSISAKIGGQSELAKKLANEFSNKSDSTAIVWVGGQPSDSFNKWVATVANEPVPRKIKFKQLSELLIASLIEIEGIEIRRKNLEKYIIKHMYKTDLAPLHYEGLSKLPKGHKSIVNLGIQITTAGGVSHLGASTTGTAKTRIAIFNYDNPDVSGSQIHENDSVGFLLMDGYGAVNLLIDWYSDGQPMVFPLGGTSTWLEILRSKIDELRHVALYNILDPNDCDGNKPIVSGKPYVLRNVNQNVYLPDVQVQKADDQYWARFCNMQRADDISEAGTIRFLKQP